MVGPTVDLGSRVAFGKMPARQPLDVETLEATLTSLTLPIGLTLDRVTIHGHGIHLDSDPFEFTLKKPGKLEVTVSTTSIASFLNTKAPSKIKDFEVAIDDGRLLVMANAKLVVTIKVVAECAFEIVGKSQLFVRLKSVGKLGSAVQKLVQRQLDDINPVLDVKDLPIEATLESIELKHGHITIRGDIKGLNSD